jgi:hypothetical protein
MSFWLLILRVVATGIGIFAVVFGEADDSPGLQGIGMLLLMTVFFSIYKIVKR